MILPVLKNFNAAKGIGFDYRFQWNQGVPPSSVPTNLSLYVADLTMVNYNRSTVYSVLTSGATAGHSGIFYGGNTGDPTNGIIDIVIVGPDVASFNFKVARYTLNMTPLANPTMPIKLLYGTFSITD